MIEKIFNIDMLEFVGARFGASVLMNGDEPSSSSSLASFPAARAVIINHNLPNLGFGLFHPKVTASSQRSFTTTPLFINPLYLRLVRQS
jgi:hypothetical protein